MFGKTMLVVERLVITSHPVSHTQASMSCTAIGMPPPVSSTHAGSHKQDIPAKPTCQYEYNQPWSATKFTRPGVLTFALPKP